MLSLQAFPKKCTTTCTSVAWQDNPQVVDVFLRLFTHVPFHSFYVDQLNDVMYLVPLCFHLLISTTGGVLMPLILQPFVLPPSVSALMKFILAARATASS